MEEGVEAMAVMKEEQGVGGLQEVGAKAEVEVVEEPGVTTEENLGVTATVIVIVSTTTVLMEGGEGGVRTNTVNTCELYERDLGAKAQKGSEGGGASREARKGIRRRARKTGIRALGERRGRRGGREIGG